MMKMVGFAPTDVKILPQETKTADGAMLGRGKRLGPDKQKNNGKVEVVEGRRRLESSAIEKTGSS
jgi:hypothetical protein